MNSEELGPYSGVSNWRPSKVFLAIHFWMLILLACNTQNVTEVVKSANRIVIHSKGVNTPREQYDIRDSAFVNGIIREIGEIDPYIPDSGRSRIPVKSNRGYFEVEIFNQDEKKAVFDVVYTTYYGVIIAMDNQYYRNDELEYLIIAAISAQE
jgi:hypothetical protein